MDNALILEISRKQFASASLDDVTFTENGDADALIKDLEHFPHAFVLGCLMDRQIQAEKAWEIPYKVFNQTRAKTIPELSSIGRDEYVRLFEKNSLHRFNEKMAAIFYGGVQDIKTKYAGNAANIWANKPSSAAVVGRFLEFEGAGPKIATMAANILVRCFKVPLFDYYSIDISADRHVKRVMTRLGLVPKNSTVEKVIYKAREISPEFPGLIDCACFETGRKWCHQGKPDCKNCELNRDCKKVID
ncbi:MAG: hypothetical protein LBR23_04380 [Spirochaetaceae bacterium]|jgi:endonuclease III|nr:hypothetical protein [Spirochaetaceae bacterium]